MSTYEWCVKGNFAKAEVGKSWKSPIFFSCGFRWYLDFYPNGNISKHKGYAQPYLYLAVLPPNIKSVIVEKRIEIAETDTVYERTNTFDNDNMAWGWPRQTLPFSAITKHRQLTIKTTISLIAVYDNMGMDVTAKYTRELSASNPAAEEAKASSASSTKMDEAMQSIKATLDSVVARLDQMDSKFEKLEQRMKVVEVNVNKLKPNSKRHPDEQALKKWLEYDVGLPQYFDVFLENHVNDLSTAKLLNLQMLQGMGIALGHRVILFDHIEKLNQNKK